MLFIRHMVEKRRRRRAPTQRRGRQTVDAVLDAVTRVLEREGAARVTTNRIAAAAGVSIGSVYQYFADKRAILEAVRDRHVAEMGQLIERRLVEHAAAPLEGMIRALVEAMIDAHALDPPLYGLLLSHLPPGVEEDPIFETRLRGALRLALAARPGEIDISDNAEGVLFVLTHLMEALTHAVVLHRPASLSLSAAKEEGIRAVVGYLDRYRTRPPASSRTGRKNPRKRSVPRRRHV
jgi:AcrR family transcriptional regulator